MGDICSCDTKQEWGLIRLALTQPLIAVEIDAQALRTQGEKSTKTTMGTDLLSHCEIPTLKAPRSYTGKTSCSLSLESSFEAETSV